MQTRTWPILWLDVVLPTPYSTRMKPVRFPQATGSAQVQDESASATPTSSPRADTGAAASAHTEGLTPRSRVKEAKDRSGVTLEEPGKGNICDLPGHLLRDIASRTDVRGAVALAVGSKHLRAEIKAIALVKAISALPAPQARALARGASPLRQPVSTFLSNVETVPVGTELAEEWKEAFNVLESSFSLENPPPASFILGKHAWEMSQIRQLPDHERAAALATLARRLPLIHDAHYERYLIFKDLARELGRLPEEHRVEASDSFVPAFSSSPKEWRAHYLYAMEPLIRTENQFNKIVPLLDSGEHVSLIRDVVHRLDSFHEHVSLPLALIEQAIRIASRSDILSGIAVGVFKRARWDAMTPENLKRTAHAALFMLRRMDGRNREDALQAAVLHLPIANMEVGARREVFDELLRLAESVPNGSALEMIVQRVCEAGDPEFRQEAFSRMLGLIERGADSYWTSEKALMHLAQTLSALPQVEFETAWEQVRAVSTNLLLQRPSGENSDHADGVIAELIKTLPRLPPEMKPEAFAWAKHSVLRLKTDFSATYGSNTQALASLASIILDLPRERRESGFETVLDSVGPVLASDRRMVTSGRTVTVAGHTFAHAEERAAALLEQLAAGARFLPGLAPRSAVDRILKSLDAITGPNRKAKVLKSLARETLHDVLEMPATLLSWASEHRNYVSRELLRTRFRDQVKALPFEQRNSALREMLQNLPSFAGEEFRALLTELLVESARDVGTGTGLLSGTAAERWRVTGQMDYK